MGRRHRGWLFLVIAGPEPIKISPRAARGGEPTG